MSTKQGLCWIWIYIKSLHYYSNISGLLCARSRFCILLLFYIFSALFFSTARQFDVSLLVTLACEPSLFFPFTPFQNCFPRISFWNCRCGRCGDPKLDTICPLKIVITILSPCLSDAPSKKSQLFSLSLPAGQDQYCCLALKCAQCPSDLCVNKALTPGSPLSFFITHIQTQIQIQIQIQILCVNKALTPSCPLSFFFSDASFPISPSFQLLAAVASQIRKLSPLNVSWDFWGQIQPIPFLDSSKPLVTMFRSPDKSSWQEKLDP